MIIKENKTKFICERCGHEEIYSIPIDHLPCGWRNIMSGKDICDTCNEEVTPMLREMEKKIFNKNVT